MNATISRHSGRCRLRGHIPNEAARHQSPKRTGARGQETRDANRQLRANSLQSMVPLTLLYRSKISNTTRC